MRRPLAVGLVAILALLGPLACSRSRSGAPATGDQTSPPAPAVESPRPPAPKGEADRDGGTSRAAEVQQSQGNLKRMMLACFNYHDTNGRLPNNVYTKDGKGLLSWRVLILPFVEEGALFKQFKLDEPWDGETNKKLVDKMPKIYAPVRGQAKAGETFYRGFAGKMAPFGPDHGKGSQFSDFRDGTSNTGLIFEAAEPVVWTKPDDLPFDPAKPLPKLGGLFDGQFNVAMADGSVRRFRADADEKELKKLINPADGERIDFAKLDAK